MMINVLLHSRLICLNLHENDKKAHREGGHDGLANCTIGKMFEGIGVFILGHYSNI